MFKEKEERFKNLHIENAISVLKWKYEYLVIFACVTKKNFLMNTFS